MAKKSKSVKKADSSTPTSTITTAASVSVIKPQKTINKKKKKTKTPIAAAAAVAAQVILTQPSPGAIDAAAGNLPKKKKKKTKIPVDAAAQPNKTSNGKKAAAERLSVTPSSEAVAAASDADAEAEEIVKILESCSNEQLIEFVLDAAISFPSFCSRIRETVDRDVSFRKLFVHGLSWDTTDETMASAFKKFGEIEASEVVVDRATGKSRGFGFVTFKTRKSAVEALKNPRMVIDNRVVSYRHKKLEQQQDGAVSVGGSYGRKIYVNGVSSDVSPDKLREFFSKFGELECGPLGFDQRTGKFRGYALFWYKRREGVEKVLEEPYKVFDGRELHCQMAAEVKKDAGGAYGITTSIQPVPTVYEAVGVNGNAGGASGITTSMHSVPPVYAAFPSQNIGNLGQDPGVALSMNPFYSSLLANPNTAMAYLNSGMGMGMGMGMIPGAGGYGGLYEGGPTAYGGWAGGPMLQGMQYAYPYADGSPSSPASNTLGAATRSMY